MDISIVVPFHNEERHIDRCIAALRAQQYPRDRYEIVMVDNNSTDRSAEIVRRYSDVRLLVETKPGSYAARNRGVAATSGAIVAFTDSDCSPAPDWLSILREALSTPPAQVVLGRQRFASESAPLSVLADYEAAKAAYTFSRDNADVFYGYTNNMAVRRAAFDRAGPFEEWMRGADSIFVHRVAAAYSPAAVVYSPAMRIQHWEITSAWRWMRKMHIYGRSYTRSRRFASRRPLTRAERLTVFKATIRDNRYSWPRSTLLTALLVAGGLSYELGRRRPARPESTGARAG